MDTKKKEIHCVHVCVCVCACVYKEQRRADTDTKRTSPCSSRAHSRAERRTHEEATLTHVLSTMMEILAEGHS